MRIVEKTGGDEKAKEIDSFYFCINIIYQNWFFENQNDRILKIFSFPED